VFIPFCFSFSLFTLFFTFPAICSFDIVDPICHHSLFVPGSPVLLNFICTVLSSLSLLFLFHLSPISLKNQKREILGEQHPIFWYFVDKKSWWLQSWCKKDSTISYWLHDSWFTSQIHLIRQDALKINFWIKLWRQPLCSIEKLFICLLFISWVCLIDNNLVNQWLREVRCVKGRYRCGNQNRFRWWQPTSAKLLISRSFDPDSNFNGTKLSKRLANSAKQNWRADTLSADAGTEIDPRKTQSVSTFRIATDLRKGRRQQLFWAQTFVG
jgi:hypothetical protein